MSLTTLIVLFVAFQIKHFVADYPLQTKYMLGKFKDYKWELPLLAHVGVHALGTFLITCWFGLFHAVLFAVFDATIHFVMDRVKAQQNLLGRFKPLTAETASTANAQQWKHNDYFWWSLGFDQMVHHLTHYFIIFWIISH